MSGVVAESPKEESVSLAGDEQKESKLSFCEIQ